MAKKKSSLKKFGETNYSKEKEYLNGVITSNVIAIDKSKTKIKFISNKTVMYIYAAIVFFVIALSIAMLGVSQEYQKSHKAIFSIIEIVVFIVLGIDVFLRWYTVEVRIKKGNWSYFLFPFTIVGAMMIASLLPSLYLINVWTGKSIGIFNTLGNMKFLRIFRLLLLANLVPALDIFRRVLSKEKNTLYIVFSTVLITILVFALVIYNIEGSGSDAVQKKTIELYNADPSHATKIKVAADVVFGGAWGKNNQQMFYDLNQLIKIHSFGEALYFSTVALTTIGFGDIYPITDLGRAITMVMSIIGIAVLATPSGVIAGGFIQEIKETKKAKAKK